MSTFDTANTFSRRSALALGAGAATLALLPRGAFAAAPASFAYKLEPVAISDGVWVIPGAVDKITAQNGGAIANVVVMDSKDGAILFDTGPSHRYGVELEATAKLLTGKPVARVYVTHIHADHSLGATAFDPAKLYGGPGLQADMKARGNDITSAMYRVTGDWMRGTGVPDLTKVAVGGTEEIGGRKLHCIPLKGHTTSDLCLYEEGSGLLLSGDIVFLDRAPTTPDANLAEWRKSLETLAAIPHSKLVPGHGPVEPGQRGIDQTRRWLDFVDGAIATHFEQGQDITEMMADDMPDWTRDVAVSRFEYQRSCMHLMPKLEATRLPILT